jgi:hypothetical protein
MSTELTQETSEIDCSSQACSQDMFEEIEGVADQRLVGQQEEDQLLQMGDHAEPCTSA